MTQDYGAIPARCQWHRSTLHLEFLRSVCIIWQGTSGNGVGIGTKMIFTSGHRPTNSIPSTRETQVCAVNEAEAGSDRQSCVALPTEEDGPQLPVDAVSDFAVSVLSNSFLDNALPQFD